MKNKKLPIDSDEESIEFTDSENIFEDLGFSKQDSVKMKMKSDLYNRIVQTVSANKYTQHEVSKILDIPQPRVSKLLTGKINNISVDSLVDYASKLDKSLRIEVVTDLRVS
ncbi:MAG: XRE family transcriptional regulator [Oligoflexus sp.]|nr:XRE family transcriptional regulator [Oligoflexus sp.]